MDTSAVELDSRHYRFLYRHPMVPNRTTHILVRVSLTACTSNREYNESITLKCHLLSISVLYRVRESSDIKRDQIIAYLRVL